VACTLIFALVCVCIENGSAETRLLDSWAPLRFVPRLNLTCARCGPGRAVQAAEDARLAKKKVLPVRQDSDAFGFEKHTKGFASKFLAKFGFKGRLGKEEQGIMKVPEVVVRPERLGLGQCARHLAPWPRHEGLPPTHLCPVV
jgi:hypothetical protein